MKNIINILAALGKEKRNVYVGEGEFMELSVTLQVESTLNLEEIEKKLNCIGLTAPNDYIQLLAYSNGIYFFEYADCQIYDLDSAISYTNKSYLDKGLLKIATFQEDVFYLNCKNARDGVYVSMEGIDEPLFLNMTFKAFLDYSLISSFSYFWTWGREESGEDYLNR